MGTMAEMGVCVCVCVCVCVIVRACAHTHKRIVGEKAYKTSLGPYLNGQRTGICSCR